MITQFTPLLGCLVIISPLSSIDLPVIIREPPHQVTKMMGFLVVEHLSIYNVILGRPALNHFRTITSAYNLIIKFPIETKIKILKVDQEESKKCYATTLKGKMDKRECLLS